MKRLLQTALILIVLFCNNVFSKDLPFEIQRLSVNLFGSAFSNRSVIVYGEACILLRSSDKGKNWTQFHIDNSELNIKKMICQSFAFYGILSKDIFFYSYNDGLNWATKKLEDNIPFNDMTIDNQNIYILSDSSILVYDLMTHNKINTISFKTNSKATDIEYMDNHLFVSSDSSKLIDFDIKNGYQQTLIEFGKLGFCSSCNNPQNIKIDNGKIYVNLGGTILKSTDKGQLWTSVSQNVSCYDVHLGNCYSLISNSDYFKNISFPVFYDVTLGTNNKISNDVITRYVYSWFYNSVDFVDDYFVIATGNNKLITISTDGGRNWNYASNINVEATASQWLNKDTGFVIYKKGQVFKTTNGGATFLPQMYNESALDLSFVDAYYFDDSGNGIIYNTSYVPGNSNFLVTKDFGNTYEAISVSELIGDITQGRLFIYKLDSTYLLSSPGVGSKNHMTILYQLDANFNVTNMTKMDSLTFFHILCYNANKEFKAVALERKYPNSKGGFDSTAYYLLHSSDAGKTWIKDLKFNAGDLWSYFALIDNNYYLQTAHFDSSKHFSQYITVIDPFNNLLVDNQFIGVNNGGSLFKFGSTLYMFSHSVYYSNDNFKNDLTNWIADSIDHYDLYGNFWFDNSTAYYASTDKSNNLRFLKLTSTLATDVSNSELLKLNSIESIIYPNPASDFIEISVVVKGSSPLQSDVKIYNVFGQNCDLTPVFSTSGEGVRIDVSGLAPGMYFVRIGDKWGKFVKI